MMNYTPEQTENQAQKLNIEARISNRARSVFNALGETINDFYLEIGIYFVGGLNASLAAWGIYTDLLINGQPPSYAIGIGLVAFIAVEGLAVFLVGAAARTNSKLLWFFSIVFALFFTYAHYRGMTGQGKISEYVTLAIPFFVVVGYWAKTVKARMEQVDLQVGLSAKDEVARSRQLADDELAHGREMERLSLDQEQAQKMAQIEVQKSAQSAQELVQMNQMNRQNGLFDPANRVIKNKKMTRQSDLLELMRTEPGLGPTALMKRLQESGYTVSVSTVKRDIKKLNGQPEAMEG